jgi:hypothetical protein
MLDFTSVLKMLGPLAPREVNMLETVLRSFLQMDEWKSKELLKNLQVEVELVREILVKTALVPRQP